MGKEKNNLKQLDLGFYMDLLTMWWLLIGYSDWWLGLTIQLGK